MAVPCTPSVALQFFYSLPPPPPKKKQPSPCPIAINLESLFTSSGHFVLGLVFLCLLPSQHILAICISSIRWEWPTRSSFFLSLSLSLSHTHTHTHTHTNNQTNKQHTYIHTYIRSGSRQNSEILVRLLPNVYHENAVQTSNDMGRYRSYGMCRRFAGFAFPFVSKKFSAFILQG